MLRYAHVRDLLLLIAVFAAITTPAHSLPHHLSDGPDPASAFLQSDAVRDALLDGNWEALLASLPRDSCMSTDPRVQLLAGHAAYALGANNGAARIFGVIIDTTSLSAWRNWTAEQVAQHPNSHIAHYLNGDALARYGDFAAALAAFDRAADLSPQFCLALNARGVVNDLSGNLDSAFMDFQQVMEYCVDFADVHASMGVNYLQRNVCTGANNAFSRAIALDPNHALAHNGRACCHAIQGDRGKATADILAAEAKLPADLFVRMNASALANPTDTTSALGRIANRQGFTDLRGMRIDFGRLAADLAVKASDFTARLQLKMDIMARFNMRKGIFFAIREGDNAVVHDTESHAELVTRFTLGYPRPALEPQVAATRQAGS
ncbi:MAG: tetratricopeptide repeat protein [Candidatus Eisenbacteria sp.]|nr:tetratricopeptide repeat protein [Candidatus Eisenbacteria bacterium]